MSNAAHADDLRTQRDDALLALDMASRQIRALRAELRALRNDDAIAPPQRLPDKRVTLTAVCDLCGAKVGLTDDDRAIRREIAKVARKMLAVPHAEVYADYVRQTCGCAGRLWAP